MKTMNHSIVRCICAIIVGVLLVAWPEAAIVYLVIAIGALFFLPGIYAVLSYLLKGKQLGMPFPLVSIGSGLFGLWLMVSPAFFVGILMYVLGAVLVFAGISQIAGLLGARSQAPVTYGYYVMPVLILLAGLVVLVNPFAAATIPVIILGISSTVYGITELIHIYKFRRKEEKLVKHEIVIEDVTPIEEIPTEVKE